MPAEDKIIREKYRILYEHLQSLPCGPEAYGMIHQDAHTGNLFVDEDYTLTLFDFDDCVYGHFIYDIAMVLFYIAGWGGEDIPGFTQRFMKTFLEGYRQENSLDPIWVKELPYFLKLREIDLFAAILFTIGENPKDGWVGRFMNGRRAKIEHEVPFIAFEWEALEAYL